MLPDGAEQSGVAQVPEARDLSFEDEIAEAFQEVAAEGMPRPFRISGEDHVAASIKEGDSETALTEPGYETFDGITIVVPRVQFSKPPDDSAREIVEIDQEPHKGKWVLVAQQADLAHYILTCKPSE